MTHDIFLRAHTVTPEKKPGLRKPARSAKWPEQVLVFDTETTIDTRQDLTFGAYRLCQLVGERYLCSEAGVFYSDDLETGQRKLLADYVESHFAEIEVKSFPPKLNLKLWSRSEFVEKVFWKAIRNGAMVVGFNLPFDLSRLAVDWRKARNGGWSLILSLRRSRKTGRVEPNPDRPRIRVTSKDSKSAFIALMRPRIADEWSEGRFLDLHTLGLALFGESFTLDGLCRNLGIAGKLNHEPTGKVSAAEIDYCLRDVRVTTNLLNSLKQEFDEHPIEPRPDQAYSPASIAKAYLDAMGVVPPRDKFKVSNGVKGIAMQAYYGGRAECRIRRVPVPVAHTDFTSQYPTVNALLGNWDVLTAENVSFEDCTVEVRKMLQKVKLENAFNPAFWKRLSFFALVLPEKDILPVRAVYNGETQNIGVNLLCSDQPIWFAGPDIVASALLSGKAPRVVKAIRMVPHGKQPGLKPTNLRGMVSVDPKMDDFFRYVVEQRKRHKSRKSLARFLKILANSGSYGLFVEITPEKKRKSVDIRVFSGQTSFPHSSSTIEREGRWYFPPIAALITAGGRLLLAMLERCVADAGGTYLFCDTDSLCIVASKRGGRVAGEGPSGPHSINALSWKQVRGIADRFKGLNPYDNSIIPDLLKIEDVNFDSSGHQRELKGYAVSAKRYVLYQQSGNDLNIIDPKAHGLGYLYPPKSRKTPEEPEWTSEAWEGILREELGLPRRNPAWLNLPAMMRVVLSTPHVLDRLNRMTRPYNFIFCPLIDTVAGFPAGADPKQFTLITAFISDRERWLQAECINIYDRSVYRLSLRQSSKLDKVIPQTFCSVLRLYVGHPESKSLGPDGTPCSPNTRGLLQRASIVAARLRYVGKETDRHWEHGEDFRLLRFTPVEYHESGRMVIADTTMRDKIAKRGMRVMMGKTGLSQHTLEAIREGRAVRRATLERVLIPIANIP